MTRPLPITLLIWLAIATSGEAADPSPFEREARPILEKSCIGCHGARRPKGGFDLSKFKDEAAVRRDPELWRRVVDALTERTMPPEGKPAPSEEERHQASTAIVATLDAIEGPPAPGPSVVQRLTREQYNHTIRDLLGVDARPADAFPVDGSGGGGFDNNASTLYVPPILLEKYLAAASEVIEKADPARWKIASPDDKTPKDEAARRCLRTFASKAYRRPVSEDEVDRLLRLFRLMDARGDSFDDSVKRTLRACLISPHFLFIGQPSPESTGPYRIGDFELASRLSYFLWSSMPDAELMDLAARGTLHDPAILDAQVARMLLDPRSKALARDFAGQWLGINRLATASEPDHQRFPTYNASLRDAMIEETAAFFHAVLREDAPLLDLIRADYAYVNQPLAEHYGIKDVTGPEFRRVKLDDPNRGGVLGMAAVLTLTSYPQRTSPVLRGKWVLEEILGTPPPPPPPDIKVLPADDRPRQGQTFRKRLENHRKDAKCASCHARMDPLGFGLENFDAIGRWRDKIGDQDVDSSGELAGGKTFKGPAELKTILIEQKKDLFVRNLSAKMLSYALGRGTEYYDAPALKKIATALEASGYRSRTLIAEVVQSYPFQYRRNEPKTQGPP